MPEISKGKYLIDVLLEIGMSKSGGFGAIPIDWQDIYAYCMLTATRLTREEVLIIRRLSRAYVSQLNSSKEDGALPPYADRANPAALLFANHPNKRKRDSELQESK